MPTDYEFAVSLNADEALDIDFIASTLRDVEMMLAAIEREVTQANRAAAHWKWAEDTRLSFVASVNGVDEQTLGRVVEIAQAGLTAAQRVTQDVLPQWPAEFVGPARESANRILQRLSDLESITVEATGHDPIIIEAPPDDTQIGVRRLRRVHSSVDGVLEMMSRKQRTRTIRAGLREASSGTYVRCFLDYERWYEEMRSRNLWDRAVRMYGRVAYRDDGAPQSIVDVDQIDLRETGIRIRDFQGAAPDLARGLSADQIIDRLRGNG
jgi:hypothetical protein